MTNLQLFFEKAREIYSAMKATGVRGRNAWNEAQHQASLFLRGIKKGVLKFLCEDGETIATVQIEKTFPVHSFIINVWDSSKNILMAFYPYQLL